MSDAIVLGLASAALVARAHDLTTRALRGWSERWGLEVTVDAAADAVEPASGGSSGHWFMEQAEGGTAAPRAALWQPADLEADLLRALYGASMPRPGGDSLAARSARHVIQELRRLLAQAWRVESWSPHDGTGLACSRWHAPLEVQVTVAGATLVARVPALRLRPAPLPVRAEPALTRAQTVGAFAAVPARVTVVVGRADISVAELANLQCGDVLLLDAEIGEPLRIDIDGAASPLRAGLGIADAQRAVQLVAFSRP